MQKKILSIILCMILCILPLSGCKKNVGTPEDNAVSQRRRNRKRQKFIHSDIPVRRWQIIHTLLCWKRQSEKKWRSKVGK